MEKPLSSLLPAILGNHQLVQQLSHRLGGRVLEDLLGSRVPEQDLALGRQGDQRIRRLVDQGLGEQRLGGR
jgi:hypothetical protein